ncbi:hypothetical protein P4C99_13555 [Pontiellaceae bacterium B1224]|nr:hypothetical protein [Pontiellaceae bacterium B1224]
MDLDTGNLYFNREAVTPEVMGEKLKNAASIAFRGASFSGDSSTVSSEALLRFLEQMDAADIAPELVNVNLYFFGKEKTAACDNLVLYADGKVVLNGESIDISALTAEQLSGRPVSIGYSSMYEPVNYRQLLAVCRVLGSGSQISSLFFVDRRMLKVAAEIYEIDVNGDKRVLSAPWQCSAPRAGYSKMGVVANESGIKPYDADLDDFHQEDLANLGIQFSIKRQFVGENIHISGVAILRKSIAPKQESFSLEGIPYYSYSVSKTVIPILLVFTPDVETIEFMVSEVDGTKTMCRISVEIQDDRGNLIKR